MVGYAVVTPLTLDDGRVVLVDRGFVPGGAPRAMLPNVAAGRRDGDACAGASTCHRQATSSSAAPMPEGPVWQHLDPRRFAEATGVAVLPIVVEATVPPGAMTHSCATGPRPISASSKHRIYMLQWYSFAALAIALWLWFWLRPRVFFGKRFMTTPVRQCAAAHRYASAAHAAADPARRTRAGDRVLRVLLFRAARCARELR